MTRTDWVGLGAFFVALLLVAVLGLGLALLTAGCAASRRASEHPVQLTPASWTLPREYAGCQVGETVRWPNGQRTVTVTCPQRTLFIDRISKLEVDPDDLDFRRGK